MQKRDERQIKVCLLGVSLLLSEQIACTICYIKKHVDEIIQ